MKCVECLIQLKMIHYTGLLTPGMGIIAGCVNDTLWIAVVEGNMLYSCVLRQKRRLKTTDLENS